MNGRKNRETFHQLYDLFLVWNANTSTPQFHTICLHYTHMLSRFQDTDSGAPPARIQPRKVPHPTPTPTS